MSEDRERQGFDDDRYYCLEDEYEREEKEKLAKENTSFYHGHVGGLTRLDYNDLLHLPSIEGRILIGKMRLEDIKVEVLTKQEIREIINGTYHPRGDD